MNPIRNFRKVKRVLNIIEPNSQTPYAIGGLSPEEMIQWVYFITKDYLGIVDF
jgi:hypothetical protein